MNEGTLVLEAQGVSYLTFDSIDCSKFSINSHSFEDAGTTSKLTLTGCGGAEEGAQPIAVVINLLPADLAALKLNTSLATGPGNTYIVVESGNGVYGQPVNEELAPSAVPYVQVAAFTGDTTPPRVLDVGFVQFDLDEGTFTLSFDEPVLESSLATTTNGGELSFLHSAEPSSLASDTFVVSDLRCPSCVNGEELTFEFEAESLNRLKANPRVCTSQADCWLTITSGFITDMSGVGVAELLDGYRNFSRYSVSFVDDTTGPLLVDFALNLTSRYLVLTFDEPVETDSFNVSGISLQGSSSIDVSNDTLYYRLTDGSTLVFSSSVITEGGVEVWILLSSDDVNGLQSRTSVATSTDTTYLTLDSSTLVDLSYSRNPAQEIPTSDSKKASVFVPDLAHPSVVTFDLNLDLNTVTLLFSEPVLVSTLNLSRLEVRSSLEPGGVSRRLSGGTVDSMLPEAAVEVTFTPTPADQTFLEVRNNFTAVRRVLVPSK